MKEKIRIFVSYSTEDIIQIRRIISILEAKNIMVLWSDRLSPGIGFTEEIKVFIEHSHIFMPVITESSSSRGWVHQEIGYAMGLHIPVYPVILGDVKPGGMLNAIHAVRINTNDDDFQNYFSEEKFYSLLNEEGGVALYQKAANSELRAALIRQYSNKIISLGRFGTVRQKGGMSSFHIPNRRTDHNVWIDRYYPENRGNYHKELQLGERRALQSQADFMGCKLIINPAYATETRSSIAAKARIKEFMDFLLSMPDEKAAVAIIGQPQNRESLTIIGDWFLAESVSYRDGDGFTNTFFTRNTSEINKRILAFDEEFSDLLSDLGWTEKNSRTKAFEKLESILKGL